MSESEPLILVYLKDLRLGLDRLDNKIDMLSDKVSKLEGADLVGALDSISSRLDDMENKHADLDKKTSIIYVVAGIIGGAASLIMGFFKSMFVGNA